jgi:hydroxypyruvate reductase
MHLSSTQLRANSESIWRAGVEAVLPAHVVPEHVHCDGQSLIIDDEAIDLQRVRRIAIVGGGKAAGAMAVALENVLGPQVLAEKQVTGWVNVPADCVIPSQRVRLHAARPPGVNEPQVEGVVGTRRILELVDSLGPDDLCLCVLTGGGSALLPAPVKGITLDDKIRVTRLLSGAGANIEQLNSVRRNLSAVKGGGLTRACRAGRLVALIISDVLGDPLDVIASGPTVLARAAPASSLAVLEELTLIDEPSIAAVVSHLREAEKKDWEWLAGTVSEPRQARVSHHILANNATAVDAAGVEAERLGYSQAMISATQSEGPAEVAGRHLAEIALKMQHEPGPDCLISGGEPTVALVEESRRGKGGRNQQLALSALELLGDASDVAFLSAGTDGEDGPTDAAGAIVTNDVVRAAHEQSLNPHDYLQRNDAYEFFHRTGGLFITGPTQTNVCDLRVICVARVVRGSPDPALA